MRIAGVQMHSELGATARNLDRAEALVREAAAGGARIVTLQEMFATGYFCATIDPVHFRLAEPVTGPTVTRMAALARELGIWLLVPFFERDDRITGRHYNTTAVVNPQGLVAGRVSKRYLPLNVTMERYYFRPGPADTPCFDTGEIKFGIIICYERHYPEIARLEVLKGAELILLVNSTYKAPNRSGIWTPQLITLAATNSVFLLAVNSCGGPDQFGLSTAVDPEGRVLDELGNDEGVLYADVSARAVLAARIRNPIVRDLRRDILERLLELT